MAKFEKGVKRSKKKESIDIPVVVLAVADISDIA